MPEQKRHKINTSHMERLNGTIRGQQARLARRTRNGSHLEEMLQYSTWLWRDLYNWTRVHYSLLAGHYKYMGTWLRSTFAKIDFIENISRWPVK